MIEYDRRVSQELLGLLLPTGALAFLVEIARGNPRMRLEFRPDDRLDLYLGRTVLLTTCLHRSGVELRCHEEYKVLSPDLFRTHPIDTLSDLRPRVLAYLESCRDRASPSFTAGEAASHAGLMRRHGLLYQSEDPLLAVDSEIRLAFRNEGARAVHEADARQRLEMSASATFPRKLDVLGVLREGGIALVEVKQERMGLVDAVNQTAAHMLRFSELRQEPTMSTVLNDMIAQKAACGLLPLNVTLRVAAHPQLCPIIAAPDGRRDWLERWQEQVCPRLDQSHGLLDSLRLWRLSEDGEILDEGRP